MLRWSLVWCGGRRGQCIQFTCPAATLSCYPCPARLLLCMSGLTEASPHPRPPSLSSCEHLRPSLASSTNSSSHRRSIPAAQPSALVPSYCAPAQAPSGIAAFAADPPDGDTRPARIVDQHARRSRTRMMQLTLEVIDSGLDGGMIKIFTRSASLLPAVLPS